MKKFLLLTLFILLFFIALFPRSVEVLNHNPIFGFDQGRDYLAVRSIVVDGKFTLIGAEIGAGSAGINGIFQGPFHYYFLAIPFIIFRGDPYGGLLLMFLLSIATVFFSLYFGKKMFGFFGGLMMALLVAVSPPLISQARFIWNSHQSSLFVLLSFYFTYYIREKKYKNIFLAAFFAGFIYNFEIAIAIPMCVAIFIYSVLIFRFKQLKQYFFMILGFVLAFLPMIMFEARHGFIGFRGLLNYILAPNRNSFPLDMGKQLMDHFNSFKYNFLGTFPGSPIPLWMLALIIILPAIYFLITEKNKLLKSFIFYLFILLVSSFFVFSFLKNAVWQFYLIELNFAYIVFFVYVIYSLFQRKAYYFLPIPLILSVIFLWQGTISAYKISKYDYSDYGGTEKMSGKLDAIDYIYKDAEGRSFGVFFFAPPIYTYPYDYLLVWYGKEKYSYLPYHEKKGTFYLLIEPDSARLWYKGWLETVIKTGQIIETKTLPSGFIIQKRFGEI
ncbi:MAG: hypothetical protein ABH816_02320 [Candidatus Levyibacteriota bacterium]